MNQSVVGFWLAVLVKNKTSLRKLYVYVYVYIYICKRTHSLTHARTHEHRHAPPHTHTHTHTHTGTHPHTSTYIEGLGLKMKHRLQHPKTGVKGDDGFCGLGFGGGKKKGHMATVLATHYFSTHGNISRTPGLCALQHGRFYNTALVVAKC